MKKSSLASLAPYRRRCCSPYKTTVHDLRTNRNCWIAPSLGADPQAAVDCSATILTLRYNNCNERRAMWASGAFTPIRHAWLRSHARTPTRLPLPWLAIRGKCFPNFPQATRLVILLIVGWAVSSWSQQFR
ncbi:hypothetical protein J6590_003844 [Homalodisca vitripennis]|nr:hypothetical protein J6590_003844 [Homalodisca vitripennis]